jgi:hypothetical protein
MYRLRNKIPNGSCIIPYWENKNKHFLNLQDSTPPPLICHIYQTGMKRKSVKLPQKVSVVEYDLSCNPLWFSFDEAFSACTIRKFSRFRLRGIS